MEERTVTVIVTGSRAFSLSFRVYKALDDLFAEYGKVHLRVGDCPTGADLYTRRWAEKFPEKVASVQVFAADWAKHGRAAGPIRNREMAQSEPKADVCLDRKSVV